MDYKLSERVGVRAAVTEVDEWATMMQTMMVGEFLAGVCCLKICNFARSLASFLETPDMLAAGPGVGAIVSGTIGGT